jgi:hypothetical protein
MVEAEHCEPADGLVVVVRRELVEERPNVVDEAGMVAGEQLERDQRRPAAGRALVLEAPPQELRLLPVPKLADRPVRDGALPIVAGAGRPLDLVLPARPQFCELTLRALSRELVRLRGG